MVEYELLLIKKDISFTCVAYGLSNTLFGIEKLLEIGNEKSLLAHILFCINKSVNKLIFDCNGGIKDS